MKNQKQVKRKVIYECPICFSYYSNINDAKKCLDKGIDDIDLPKGLVLKFLREQQRTDSYLVLSHKFIDRHISRFEWDVLSLLPGGDLKKELAPYSTPSDSEILRKMLFRENEGYKVKPLTEDKFQDFYTKANRVQWDRRSSIEVIDYTEIFQLSYDNPELERIIEEERCFQKQIKNKELKCQH